MWNGQTDSSMLHPNASVPSEMNRLPKLPSIKKSSFTIMGFYYYWVFLNRRFCDLQTTDYTHHITSNIDSIHVRVYAFVTKYLIEPLRNVTIDYICRELTLIQPHASGTHSVSYFAKFTLTCRNMTQYPAYVSFIRTDVSSTMYQMNESRFWALHKILGEAKTPKRPRRDEYRRNVLGHK